MSMSIEKHREQFAARCDEHEANLRNLRDYAEPVFALLHLLGGPEPETVAVEPAFGGAWRLSVFWHQASLNLIASKDELHCTIGSGLLRASAARDFDLTRGDVEAIATGLLRFIVSVFRTKGAMPEALAISPTDADLLRRLLDDTWDEPPPWTRTPLKHVLTDAQRLACVRELFAPEVA